MIAIFILIALCQFKKPVNTPENYADIFYKLSRLGVIDHDFCERLVQMAKFGVILSTVRNLES